MTDRNDESFERVEARVRDGFPEGEVLSSESVERIRGRLRQHEVARRAPSRARLWVRIGAVTVAVGAVAAIALFASAARTAAPRTALVPVPQLALAAIDKPATVLHYTSTMTKSSIFRAKEVSDEELWLDADNRLGKVVTRKYKGEAVVETETLVADAKGAYKLVERAGKPLQRETFRGSEGPWWQEIDKIEAYRNMLESDVATVTGEGSVDGVPTYKVEAVLADIPAPGYEIRMAAEIRKSNYLPVTYSSTFIRLRDGNVMRFSERTFDRFEMVPLRDMPSGFFSLLAGESTQSPEPRGTEATQSPEPSGAETTESAAPGAETTESIEVTLPTV